MSLPKSRILSASRSFAAQTEVHNNSPENNTIVNVNVNQNAEKDEPSVKEVSIKEPPKEESSVPFPSIFERDVEPQPSSFDNDLSKDNLINALSLIISIIENNPLVVNKQVIADIDSLSHLISYLTEADSVDVQTSTDVECSCIGSSKFIAVDKILITKNNQTLNFKYHFADALKILDDHHISVKFVIDSLIE